MFIRFADLCVIVRMFIDLLCSMIYVLLLGLLMFIRFAERGTAVFHDLCVIVRVVDVYHDLCVIVRVVDVYKIWRERNGCVL